MISPENELKINSPLNKVRRAWRDIKSRCYKETHKEYKRYGGRGITIQNSWLSNSKGFCNYVMSLPDFDLKYSLDRIDNNKGYEEGNLRWASDAQQTRNQGKQSNNTSGVCGVTWYFNRTGGTRAIAWWYDLDGKPKSKSFPEKKFGLLPAFKMAAEHRKSMIKELNRQGAGYSETHGN